VVQYGAFSEAYQDLVNKRSTPSFTTSSSLSTLVGEKAGHVRDGTERVGEKSYAAWAVQKGNKGVVDYLNTFLAQQKSSGSMKKLQTQWLKITFDDMPSQPMLPGDRPIR
jgi:polar amino acid transport system substrate-binding protein